MRASLRLISLLAILIGLAACAVPRPGGASPMSWVWILTGPKDAQVTGDARGAAFRGHFANMERMANEGQLLVAGPFGEPRARADHRGVFVLATPDLAVAREVADSDPTAQAGVFVFEVEPFATSDALERLASMHTAAVAASGVVDPPPGFHCRAYVLVTGRPSAVAERALAAAPVLFSGRIGDGESQRWLACLDVTTAEEARALLPPSTAEWTVMPWFATNEVARLR
ncbi:MAG: hypothetical protein KDC98_26795 [Planctomycetes bacterium]|nr:hypothetical protein [Planctomycetota bacterium]